VDGPHVGTVNGEIAYAVLELDQLASLTVDTLDECLENWARTLPSREVGGTLVRRPWELIDLNPSEITNDFAARPSSNSTPPVGFALVGPYERLFIDPTARIDPMVVADTTNGPVVIGPGATVQAFTRLEGPCGIGTGAMVFGAKIRSGTTIGPYCRVGGEVECSILLGYANKYHEGFLGHSYVGEWVNLAAGTHTSDLRCDYRPVTVPVDGVEVPTGRTKVGAVIADHVRTGLGVLLDCGSVIGPFAQVLPFGGFAPRAIPGFHRFGIGGMKELTDIDRLIATADAMMRRRGQRLSAALETAYRAATPAFDGGRVARASAAPHSLKLAVGKPTVLFWFAKTAGKPAANYIVTRRVCPCCPRRSLAPHECGSANSASRSPPGLSVRQSVRESREEPAFRLASPQAEPHPKADPQNRHSPIRPTIS